jgi:methionine--tRNA ligase beta chain
MLLPLPLSLIALSLRKNNMPEITYEQFAALEIKIGTILSVEIVEGADKLLKLAVDIGEDTPRQILSGIRTYFEDPQILVGQQCPFVTNLAPRTIRGFESQGMIMAASAGEDAFALLHPSVTLPSGTKVK